MPLGLTFQSGTTPLIGAAFDGLADTLHARRGLGFDLLGALDGLFLGRLHIARSFRSGSPNRVVPFARPLFDIHPSVWHNMIPFFAKRQPIAERCPEWATES